MSEPSRESRPIFVLGISQRSGTNFFSRLLLLHPHCARPPDPIREDFLLHHSGSLSSYATTMYGTWSRWGEDEGLVDTLCRHFGDALVKLLSPTGDGLRLVTKTPSVLNIEHFFRFFPRADLLILVRDGRSLVESKIRSFGGGYERVMRSWADGADGILRLRQEEGEGERRFRIVRYEDLWLDVEGELRAVMRFAGLDASLYDFDAARELPVRGSSTFGRDPGQRLNWEESPKTDEFRPLERWKDWSRARHRRFNWIAGRQMGELGYPDLQHRSDGSTAAALNHLLDSRCRAKRAIHQLTQRVKRLWRPPPGAVADRR